MTTSPIRLALLALAASTLVACGGGDSPASPAQPTEAAVLKVEPLVQPVGSLNPATVKERAFYSPAPQAAMLSLGPLTQAKDFVQDINGVHQVGAARVLQAAATPEALSSQLRWTKTPTGALVAAVSVTAQGAYGVRLGLHVTALPGSAAIRVYSQERPNTVYEVSGQHLLQTIERNLAAGDDAPVARTWWTPELGDAEQTLEIELPAGTDPSALQVSIPTVSHIFEDLSLPQADALVPKINDSEVCNLDASCYDNLAAKRNAVARMLFNKNGGTYVCTGTLMNDVGGTFTPYFLSANHCISSQTVASSLQTDWFYRSSSCNARTLSSQTVRRSGGATLLYASDVTDTAFLRLNEAPPSGVTFAGWDANSVGNGASVYGLHHPRGDMLKVSFGNVIAQANCRVNPDSTVSCRDAANSNFYRTQWTSGTTEGGSSGSALFRDGYVVGQLYAGAVTCTASQSSDFYGRFDLAFNAGIKTWLAAGGNQGASRASVYRFYNATTGAHFYTASADERDYVVRTYPLFRYEGPAFYAYPNSKADLNPVFRFYNTASGAHFYTASAGERDHVFATYPTYNYEGASWYAQASAGGDASAMYRFYNARTNAHFYTISPGERDFVINNNPDFRFEGTAYFAWTAP